MSHWALHFILKGVASLPLSLAQILGGLGGIMAYTFSSHFRGLFQENYHHAMQLHGRTIHPLRAAAASGMLFIDSLWIWHNPQKALERADVAEEDPLVRHRPADPHRAGRDRLPADVAPPPRAPGRNLTGAFRSGRPWRAPGAASA